MTNKTMKILITAGGTSEAIDPVRSITNYSTGRLGSIIADEFAQKNAEVFYISGSDGVLPSSKKVAVIRIKDVQGLTQALDRLLKEHKYDCVIHSMAVSDFTPQAVLNLDDIITSVASAVNGQKSCMNTQDLELTTCQMASLIREAVLSSGKPPGQEKISSKNSDLVVLFKQTPKAIKMIKAIQPETILVGFKLLSGAPEDALLQAANNLLTQNSCDFVLANDMTDIAGDQHKAILIDKNGPVQKVNTKQEIAKAIYKAILERNKTH